MNKKHVRLAGSTLLLPLFSIFNLFANQAFFIFDYLLLVNFITPKYSVLARAESVNTRLKAWIGSRSFSTPGLSFAISPPAHDYIHRWLKKEKKIVSLYQLISVSILWGIMKIERWCIRIKYFFFLQIGHFGCEKDIIVHTQSMFL